MRPETSEDKRARYILRDGILADQQNALDPLGPAPPPAPPAASLTPQNSPYASTIRDHTVKPTRLAKNSMASAWSSAANIQFRS